MIEKKNSFLALPVKEFLCLDVNVLMEKMKAGFQWYVKEYSSEEESPSYSQERSWKDCLEVLQEALNGYSQQNEWLVFEYCLPQEGGRRPDVLLINAAQVLVLEFKRKEMPALSADIDQASSYRSDLEECHAGSHQLDVKAFLVLTKEQSDVIKSVPEKGIIIVSRSMLARALQQDRKAAEEIDIENWLIAPYEPSIAILEAARRVMEEKDLPEIRRAKSSGINQTLSKLECLYAKTKQYKTHSVVFITGVPGAGKTYLGLQYTYALSKEGPTAVYLSGNRPLVEILQHILTDASKVLVRRIDKFLRGNEFQRGTCTTVVFDEGQRAWNSKGGEASEPEKLLEFLKSSPWGMLVVLIGEGQQIGRNETIRPVDWANAIAKYGNPNIFCPPSFEPYFSQLKPKIPLNF